MANNGRGKSPGSRKALEDAREKTAWTHETALKASAKAIETKREYKTFREGAKEQLTPDVMAKITAAILEKAMAGDVRAYEVIRDTMGEKPKDAVELSGAGQVRFTFGTPEEDDEYSG